MCDRLRRCLVVIGLGVALNLNAGARADADVVAVVSAKSPVTALRRTEIADIFLGRLIRFPDGTQIVPIDLDEGSASRAEFYALFADKTPAQLKAHWSKIIFTGRGKPPATVPNGIEARKLVALNPQAISYMDRSLLDSSVRALRVE